MAKQRFNPCLAKIHRNYTVDELAKLYNVHRQTVRQWIKQGLQVCKHAKPHVVMGADVGQFHRSRRIAAKRPCKPGEIYCMRCRQPKVPRDGAVTLTFTSETLGVMAGACPCCEGQMYRRTSVRTLLKAKGNLILTLLPANLHKSKSPARESGDEMEKSCA